tara:strand:- start:3335 stop:4045 length:711 start_codon:yes stop_codon:yes gene_type:complete
MKDFMYKNIKFFVPSRYYHDNLLNRFRNNFYEKAEATMVNKYYKENDVVLEMGTCLGYISYILSKNVKSVISIEGNPELSESIKLFKKENNINNVHYINGYISNTKNMVDFQTYSNIVAGSGDRKDKNINNVRGWGNTQKIYKIKPTKLNDIPEIENVNSLVMDIEGGELIFLQENIEFIKNQINKITFEVHGHLMYGDSSPLSKNFNNECFKLLIDNNFVLKDKHSNTYHFEKKL